MKKVFAVVIIVMLFFAAAGCGQGGSKDQGGEEEKTSIKIGFIAALSGNSADMGVPARNGAQIAVEEINAAGGINGRQVELIDLDDEANPAKSVTQATKLIQQDKVVASICGTNSGTALAMRQPFYEAETLAILPIGTMDAIIDHNHPTFVTSFRTGATESYMIGLMSNYIKSKGYKTIGVIADTSAYGQTAVQTIKKIFAEQNITLGPIVNHEVAATDLTSQVLTLKNANVDAVYLYNLGPDAALTLKTIRQMNWNVPTMGARGLNMKAFLDLAKEFAEGVIIPCDVDNNKPEAKAFIAKYDAKHGKAPNYMFSVMGYDAARLIIEALKATNGEGGKKLIDAMNNIKEFPATMGQPGATFNFSPEQHEAATKKMQVLLTVKNGQFEIFNEFPPEQ